MEYDKAWMHSTRVQKDKHPQADNRTIPADHSRWTLHCRRASVSPEARILLRLGSPGSAIQAVSPKNLRGLQPSEIRWPQVRGSSAPAGANWRNAQVRFVLITRRCSLVIAPLCEESEYENQIVEILERELLPWKIAGRQTLNLLSQHHVLNV